jgi:hypothetical protein
MKKEFDQLLCNKYPKLFVERDLPMSQTAMCWGFSCGDGWFNIINNLCANIQSHIDWKNKNEEVVKQVVVQQVKEKFGTLRFYYTGGDEYIAGLVSMAESMSACTCESCGNPGKQTGGGWIRTICTPCNEKLELERKQQEEEWQQRKLLKEGFEE